ncbi:elongator complex protein 4 [Magnaporthiopsis poae ATCC 64411]|uniref:Elongator complex protein 4 n=1 Tax=Magnaporthiopsis poae (strain ATCC 64411 / 73-15) TaxID=644358 RepID=A0A0C4DY69_MAGP6|nr:elongator complex protein 4 [Magnaporthiopsis poae ATCC 64411]
MSFRKRNAVISASPSAAPGAAASARQPGQAHVQQKPPQQQQLAPGLRPSPLDGRLTTSTGTASLDALLAGHAGMPMGTSVLVEEQGTTDFAGALLRYYAAEGLVQGHHVHVLGFPEAWKFELPGLASPKSASRPGSSSEGKPLAPAAPGAEDRMKIAWRYEALGNSRNQSLPVRDRDGGSAAPFCHSYDLTKRLAPSAMKGQFHAVPSSHMGLLLSLDLDQVSSATTSPFGSYIKHLRDKLASSPPESIHRVVVPSLLSPTLYAGGACDPTQVLQFLHSLRGLLRLHPRRLTALLSLPVSLHPRGSGLTRWMELLCDGVIELVPLPATIGAGPPPATSGKDSASSKDADKAQGMVNVYTLPVYHEKGGGGAEGNYFRDTLSFSLSSSRGLVIQPYSLPPMEDDEQKEKSPASTVKDGIDF